MCILASLAMEKKKERKKYTKKEGGQMLFPHQIGKDFLNVLQFLMSQR